ncbi:putative Permease of the major facilitator superfamily [Vibrio nigripulchritudo SOn1]|uniref:Permease of the major facilitator superfamily n=2 Tax=Vibrio nigripulchritudo TaxID=28173 RepID=A0AAV2VMD6_9VIBR|nr:putative Permease of the major facilitator superfamily [Vibrio nigripulchritudo SOn1]
MFVVDILITNFPSDSLPEKTRVPMRTNIFIRIRPILFAIFAFAISHNLFFIMLPIRLKDGGFDSSDIGLAMSMFAAGAICAGLFGSKAVLRVGHIRAFASMAATLAIVSVMHSYTSDIKLTSALRMISGFCYVTSFITLESWLNVLSDRSNRGRVYGTYQICFAIGFGTAPFLIAFSGAQDPRIFGIISVFLCIALIIMSMSRLPMPELPEKSAPLTIKKLWNYSPSGTLSCFCAGLINAASVSLISLYAYGKGISGIWLSLILGSYQVGGLLTQFPTGWLADRYDKRVVASGLMFMGVISNTLIIMENYFPMPIEMLAVLFWVSGGSGVALFPLAVTQVFDHIEPKEAMPATSTMQILLGVGGVVGPIIAGYLMSQFSIVWLYYYLIVIHLFVFFFLLFRKLFMRTDTLESVSQYQVNVQPIPTGTAELDPMLDFKYTDIADPELKLLIAALGQNPTDPGVLFRTALEGSSLKANDVAINIALAYPKQSGELLGELINQYPQRRLEIAHSLHDFFMLKKTRINALIYKALLNGASPEESKVIRGIARSTLEMTG